MQGLWQKKERTVNSKRSSFFIYAVSGILTILLFLSACAEKRGAIEGGGDGGRAGPAHTHSFVLRNDSERHWQECECGEKKGEGEHTYNAAACAVCGYCAVVGDSLPRSYRDVPYGNHPLQKMDIDIPAGAANEKFPVVLTIHGGEWTSGDKSWFDIHKEAVLGAGCIRVNLDHRLLGNGIAAGTAPYEQMLDDIEQALDYLKQHAEEYSVDVRKAAILGYSSGGHLALMYAYTRASNNIPIDAVISLSGPANFLDPRTFTGDGDMWHIKSHGAHTEDLLIFPGQTLAERLDIIGKITGTAYGAEGWEKAWADASPVYHAQTSSPKTLLLYGTHDDLVPLSHAGSLQSRLSDCTLIEMRDTSHDIINSRDDIAFDLFLTELDTILSGLRR